jgi:hypothetical protein
VTFQQSLRLGRYFGIRQVYRWQRNTMDTVHGCPVHVAVAVMKRMNHLLPPALGFKQKSHSRKGMAFAGEN